MTPLTPETEDVLRRAAELRAAGSGWEAVARRMECDPDELQDLALEHHTTYGKLLRIARRDVIDDGIAEALCSLRVLVRSKNEDVSRRAAEVILKYKMTLVRHTRRSGKPKPDPRLEGIRADDLEFARFLSSHTDEQREELVASWSSAASGDRASRESELASRGCQPPVAARPAPEADTPGSPHPAAPLGCRHPARVIASPDGGNAMSDPVPTPPAPENTPAATPPAPPTPEAATPAAPTAAPPATAPAGSKPGGPGRGGPPQPGGPRSGGPKRPFPQGNRPPREKPLNPGGSPPQLRDFSAIKPNNRELDAMIEDELAQAMSGFSVESTVAKVETQQKPQAAGTTPGHRKKGRIVGIHGKDVFVEVPGGRSQGVLPLMQFEGRIPAVGEEVEFDIERYDAGDGLLVLTREGSAQVVTDWSSIALHMIVEARITGTNKNKTGLTVEVNGIKGFLPASQLDLYRVEDLDQFLNQKMKVQIVEVSPEERNLIVSRRALLEKERAQKAEQFWTTIAEGQVLKGIVKSIKPFGAFVDLGGADGLIPVSEFSWQRVNDLSEYVKLGQEVQVLVSRLDRDARKIGLSVKQLTTSPWDEFATRVKAGARVTGKVTRTADFGAFVELEPGVEGLIHISELSTQRVRRVRDILSEGQSVDVEILSVDPAARRIALSLKRIAQEKEDAADSAEEAEREADLKAAAETMANRPVNPNLRGGIGSAPIKFDSE